MPFCTACATPYELGNERCAKCGSPLPATPARTTLSACARTKTWPASTVVPLEARVRRLAAGLLDFLICVGLTVYFDRALIPRLLLRSRFRGLPLAFVLLMLPAAYAVFRDMFGGKSLAKLFSGLM